MKLRGIHFGLTLLYSYLLPLYSIEEFNGGFLFRKITGVGKGLECVFREKNLETHCRIPSGVEISQGLLGLDKQILFREVCKRVGVENCIAKHITLIYEPRDKELIFYSVYLSRNTDYYINTVKWIYELVTKGTISSTSYTIKEFIKRRDYFRQILNKNADPLSEAIELLNIKGVGVKSIKAYLLHAYGLTIHAPIDRHYARILRAKPRQPSKNICAMLRLNCTTCTLKCLYGYTTRLFGLLNGIIQSLSYIYYRLKSKRRSIIEEILIPDPSHYVDDIEKLLNNILKLSPRS